MSWKKDSTFSLYLLLGITLKKSYLIENEWYYFHIFSVAIWQSYYVQVNLRHVNCIQKVNLKKSWAWQLPSASLAGWNFFLVIHFQSLLLLHTIDMNMIRPSWLWKIINYRIHLFLLYLSIPIYFYGYICRYYMQYVLFRI